MNCAYCQQTVRQTRLCPGCKKRLYCSQQCRLADWYTTHQLSCGLQAAGQVFSLQDFKAGKELGKGAYGQVKLVLHVPTHTRYALKVVSKSQFQHEKSFQAIKREIRLHQSLDHPHIVKLHDYLEDADCLYLVLEYAARGSLFQHLQQSPVLSEPLARHYFLQTCLGVQYLHSHDVIHRDIKPENLLVTASYDVKICDFGSCSLGSETSSAFGGTLDYLAPEVVAGTVHSFAVDIWALGVLLFELVHGRAPFNAEGKSEKCKQILSLAYTCDPALSSSLQALIRSLLRAVPQHRLSLSDILAHPWVQEGPVPHFPSVDTDVSETAWLDEVWKEPSDTVLQRTEAPAPLEAQPPPREAVSPPKPRSLTSSARTKSVIHSPTIQSSRKARLDALLLAAQQLPAARPSPQSGLIRWMGSFLDCTKR